MASKKTIQSLDLDRRMLELLQTHVNIAEENYNKYNAGDFIFYQTSDGEKSPGFVNEIYRPNIISILYNLKGEMDNYRDPDAFLEDLDEALSKGHNIEIVFRDTSEGNSGIGRTAKVKYSKVTPLTKAAQVLYKK